MVSAAARAMVAAGVLVPAALAAARLNGFVPRLAPFLATIDALQRVVAARPVA
jgi:hypothetical protein